MRRLLIAHPDSVIRESLCFLLQSEGFAVVAVDGAAAALDLCRTEEPAIVIAGASTAWCNSQTYDLVPALRSEFPSLVIVTLSGDGAQSAEHRAMEKGATHHLATPVQFPQVLSLVRGIVSSKEDSAS